MRKSKTVLLLLSALMASCVEAETPTEATIKKLIEPRLGILGIEFGKHIAFVHQLIISDMDGDDLPSDLRRDMQDMGVDEGIVGVFILAGIQPPDQRRHRQQDDKHNQRQQQWQGLVLDLAGTEQQRGASECDQARCTGPVRGEQSGASGFL